MAEVARRAGVSVSTVSHVLNDTRYVREETRRLVLEAVDDTGYTPNTLARSLATTATQCIGLVLSALSNPYFGDLVHVIETEARRKGYTLFLSDSHEEPEVELQAIQALHQRRVDGVIIAPAADTRARTLRYLTESDMSAVIVDRLAWDRFDQVGTENVEATAQLVEHLIGLGHQRVGMVSGLHGLSTTRERVAGYRRALETAGLAHDDRLVASGESGAAGAYDAVHQLLALPHPPSALVVANNSMTIGTMRALREKNRRVPDDMALTSFDDFEWADLFSPRLTTIAQPIQEIGATAVRMLLDRLDDPRRAPRTLRLEPHLVHRESCGCPAGYQEGTPA